VRRIEALTGKAALAHSRQSDRMLQETARLLKDTPEALPQRVTKLIAENKALEKEVERLKFKLTRLSASGTEDDVQTVNGVKVLAKRVAADSPAALRELADQFKGKMTSGIVVLGAAAGGKAFLIALVSKDLSQRYHAGHIVKELSAMVGGSGGGRPDMAQAGGTQPENLDQALQTTYEIVQRI
jgi:alanyl-tRNA synthetase